MRKRGSGGVSNVMCHVMTHVNMEVGCNVKGEVSIHIALLWSAGIGCIAVL